MHGVAFIPIILGSDKTMVSVATGQMTTTLSISRSGTFTTMSGGHIAMHWLLLDFW